MSHSPWHSVLGEPRHRTGTHGRSCPVADGPVASGDLGTGTWCSSLGLALVGIRELAIYDKGDLSAKPCHLLRTTSATLLYYPVSIQILIVISNENINGLRRNRMSRALRQESTGTQGEERGEEVSVGRAIKSKSLCKVRCAKEEKQRSHSYASKSERAMEQKGKALEQKKPGGGKGSACFQHSRQKCRSCQGQHQHSSSQTEKQWEGVCGGSPHTYPRQSRD